MSAILGPLIALALVVCVPEAQSARSPKWVTHKVKRGDTLGHIAKRYNTTASKIRRLNGLTRRSAILPGQRLKIRARLSAKEKKARAAKERKAAKKERKAAKKEARKSRSSKRAARKAARSSGWITHKVRRGDHLWGIADKYDVTIRQIVRHNRLGKRRRIHPGMVLRIKEGSSQRLLGGVTLPRKGPGYVAVRPKRSWGTPGTVRLIQEVYAEVAERHPGTVPGIVADLSKEGGGLLKPHRSHQRGVDVDVSYFKVGNKKTRGLEVMTAETFDVVKNWDLIRAFINTGRVSVIFMDHKLQGVLHAYLVKAGYDEETLAKVMQYPRSKNERRGILRHHPGHHHHLHVRFTCESANDPCSRPAVALIPDLPNRTAVAAAAAPRRPAPRAAAAGEGAPVEVARAEARPERLERDAGTWEAPRRDSFADIAGLRGPQPGLDAYARLEAEAAPMPPVSEDRIPSAAPAEPRGAERALRMTRFGCVNGR